MGRTRVIMGLLLAGGMLCASWGALAQERSHPPYPPPPIKPGPVRNIPYREPSPSGGPIIIQTQQTTVVDPLLTEKDSGPGSLPPVPSAEKTPPEKEQPVPEPLAGEAKSEPSLPLIKPLPATVPVSPPATVPAASLEKKKPEPRPAPVPFIVPIRRDYNSQPAEPVVSQSSRFPEVLVNKKIQAPLLTLEKKGPASVILGQPVRYEIVVHNVGSVPVPQVWVEDILPANVGILGGNPQPQVQGNHVQWILDNLDAGSEKRVQLDLQPQAAGELPSQTRLVMIFGSNTTVTPAPLSLSVFSPGRVAPGRQATFQVHLVNNSDRTFAGMILNAQLAEGLNHQKGNLIELTVDELPPGTAKDFTLAVTTIKSGMQSVDFRLLAQDREQARARGRVLVGESSLSLQVPASTRVLLNRTTDLAIEVANFHDQPARRLMVTATLPTGVEFAGASDRGLYRPSTRTAWWILDNLSPGKTKTLVLKIKGKNAGQAPMACQVTGANNLKAQAHGILLVEGRPELTLKVNDRDDPLEAGRETVYEIVVSNRGTSPDTDVQIQVSLPAGMVFRNAGGPARYRLEGQQVIFEPLPRLNAHSQAVFHVMALAQSPGDCRLRVQMASSQLRIPVIREENTRVYKD